jgi:hypothetical protein
MLAPLCLDGFFACQYASSIPSDQVTAHHLIQAIRVAGARR